MRSRNKLRIDSAAGGHKERISLHAWGFWRSPALSLVQEFQLTWRREHTLFQQPAFHKGSPQLCRKQRYMERGVRAAADQRAENLFQSCEQPPQIFIQFSAGGIAWRPAEAKASTGTSTTEVKDRRAAGGYSEMVWTFSF